MRPKDYAELTEIQKAVLIDHWNQEMKEQERQIKKGGRRRGKKRY